jgi:hypothetical protein
MEIARLFYSSFAFFLVIPAVTYLLMYIVKSFGLIWLGLDTACLYPAYRLGLPEIQVVQSGFSVATKVGVATTAAAYGFAATTGRFVYGVVRKAT